MPTTSANIAGTPGPFAVAGHGTRPWPYGSSRVYKIDEIKPKKKKKGEKLNYGQVGMLYVNTKGHVTEAFTEPVGNPKDGLWKIPKLGKIGVWRTVRGRRHFFPVDGSSPIPKMHGGKKKAAASGGGSAPKKKKKKGGLLSKIMGLLGGGGGASASAKDVKPKKSGKGSKKKSGGGKGIPNREGLASSTDDMILKASRSKSGKKMVGPLKAMKAALKDGDEGAFRKAEASLAKATSKLSKRKGH